MTARRRAVFLDRDGVINVNRPNHVTSWDEFVFEQGSLEAMLRLGATKFVLVIVTNQSAIGRGQITHETVQTIHAELTRIIETRGGRIDRIYYCPHAPEDKCTCRKPAPEMLLRGQTEFNLDLAGSYFIGDWIDDVRAAHNAGATPLLVRTGRGERAIQEIGTHKLPVPRIFENLAQAVEWILDGENKKA